MKFARVLALVALVSVLAPTPARAGLDGFNKANLRFNRWLLVHVLEPTARGWNAVMPKWGQRRVVDFMRNLEGPRDILNSLGQAKLRRAGVHTGRFVVNTTAGVAGFFDVAGPYLKLRASPETFDETLGVWRLPPGAYIILPVMGDVTTRSLVGRIADGFLNPLGYIPGAPPVAPTAGAYLLDTVNLLAQTMPSPRAPEGQWDAYEQSRFDFPPYERGREMYYIDQAERVED